MVLAALAVHAFVTYGLILKLFTGLNLGRFFKQMRRVQLFAFSTASSNATLPLNMENAEHNLGVKPSVASFTIPLGATVNMDGTAKYTGSFNDRDIILQNIGGVVPTNTRVQQVP